jgi:CO/xanthine dehydrogenase Mo-binding subunit
MPKRYVGKNIYKVDAREKVTGKAIYSDDIYFREPLILMPIFAELI